MKNDKVFSKFIHTLKKTSQYKKEIDGKKYKKYMTDSQLEVVNFDCFKGWYLNNLHKTGYPTSYKLKSVDALYISNAETLIFIEFKSGNIKESDIRRKVSDSVMIYLDYRNEKLSTFRTRADFILVCSEDSREHFGAMLEGRGDSEKERDTKSDYQDLKGFYFVNTQILSPKELEQKLSQFSL